MEVIYVDYEIARMATRVIINVSIVEKSSSGVPRDTRAKRPNENLSAQRQSGRLPVARASIAAAGGAWRADADRPGPAAPAADGPASPVRQRPAAALRRRPPAASDSAE